MDAKGPTTARPTLHTTASLVLCMLLALAFVACGQGKEPRKVQIDNAPKAQQTAGEDKGNKPSDAPPADAAPKTPLPEGAVALTKPLDAQALKDFDALQGKMRRGLFPWSERNKRDNARLFLHAAARGASPQIVAAGLQAMAQSWTSNPKDDKRELVDEDFVKVIQARLMDKDKVVLARAMEAAPAAISGNKPDEAIIGRLAQLLADDPDPAARYAALVAVARARNFQKRPEVTAALLKSLDDQAPYVVSTAMLYTQFAAYSLDQREAFLAKATALLEHKDPGVRGRAVLFAANLAKPPEREALSARIKTMLGDEHAYVRSTAASALASLGRTESIHDLMKLLEDDARNTYTIKDFKKLSGEPGTVPHSGSSWYRVSDAALTALKVVTLSLKDKRFEYRQVRYKTADADIAEAIKDAKRWYKTHKAALPPAAAPQKAP